MEKNRETFIRKLAMSPFFLFMFYLGFNAAGLMKNITHQGAFVSPLFTVIHEEAKPVGLLKRMYSQPNNSIYQESYTKLFVGQETLPLSR